MFVYEFNKKIYCRPCYMKAVPKDEQKPGHRFDSNEFFHRFQYNPVKCDGCGFSIRYDFLYTTTNHSLGEHDKEED